MGSNEEAVVLTGTGKHPLTRPPNRSTIPTGGMIHRLGGNAVPFHSIHGEHSCAKGFALLP